ncbi:prepilin peptidase [Fructobacillus sp. M2-14]|uniref:Prepilin peptidase n=1 Tax=Fructobacillus broussonetiae TaxID=2713173 RepID=A0ABS5R220_9LACO|nr:prepilin peptidase [Fructobacillus broussonetiae]MBS9339077.1 prepilin peptidase [Fructobacillus broussonetiae]
MEKLTLFLFLLFSQSVLASFLCCLADRSVSGVSLWKGRSFCYGCKRTLKPCELIPFWSAFFLLFRCSVCQKRFTNLWDWLFYEGIFPLAITFVCWHGLLAYLDGTRFFEAFHANFLLCYPLFFLARQDQQSRQASTDGLWLVILLLGQDKLPCALFLAGAFFCAVRMGKLGVGDVPVLVTGGVAWCGWDFGIWICASSLVGLVTAGVTRKRAIPFIPSLLMGWIMLLLFHCI